MPDEGEEVGKGLVEGLIEALSDKHTQLDVRLRGLTLNLRGGGVALVVNGTVTVAVHMREITDEERAAYVAHNVAAAKT